MPGIFTLLHFLLKVQNIKKKKKKEWTRHSTNIIEDIAL